MKGDNFAIDGHKLYWHLERVLGWQQKRLIAPIYLEISPVSYCNHRCCFCGLDFAHNERLALDKEILRTRIEEMGRLGVKSIMFAGEGEPLLHPHLSEIAAHTQKCGIDVSLTTNGMTGNAETWSKLLPSLTWVRFSVDAATADTYASVHGVSADSFAKTIASIKAAVTTKRQQNLPVTIGVQFLMIQQNLADIEAALSLCSDCGVDYLSLKPYSEHPQMINKSGFTYSDEMISEIEQKVTSFVGNGITRIIFRKSATETYSDGVQRFNSCCALPFWGYVSSKGDFYTCSVYLNDDRFKVGNIYSESMESIFFGAKRAESIAFAEHTLKINQECRVNCRMARINEFLAVLNCPPDHINFI